MDLISGVDILLTMSHRMLFLRKFLRHGTRIASITPSSRWMCRQLARYVDPNKPQRILELGAGTGVVTREIESRMHPDSTLVAYEPDPDFAEILSTRGGRAEIRNLGVETLETNEPEDLFDVVVSGLPVPSFSEDLRRALFLGLRIHAPRASYAQLTEFPLVYKAIYTKRFARVRFTAVPLNIPPGGVYHCRGLVGERKEDA